MELQKYALCRTLVNALTSVGTGPSIRLRKFRALHPSTRAAGREVICTIKPLPPDPWKELGIKLPDTPVCRSGIELGRSNRVVGQ